MVMSKKSCKEFNKEIDSIKEISKTRVLIENR